MAEIGLKELKATASAVIEQVEAGTAYVVTKRGRPAAVLLPIEEAEDLVLANADEVRTRVRHALERLARDAAHEGRIGGKAVKTIRGVSDSFHRLRVGDYRVMYDVIDEDAVILVLGIVHRGDLERWIRNR